MSRWMFWRRRLRPDVRRWALVLSRPGQYEPVAVLHMRCTLDRAQQIADDISSRLGVDIVVESAD